MNKQTENTDIRTTQNKGRTPLVSVIIPAYNHEQWIVETLNSVFRQSMADFEVIVVDDGSQDQTVQAISSCQDSRLRLVVQENRGTAAALNRGLSLSRGKYIAILNSDDLFMADRLAVLVDCLETYPESMMAFSKVGLIDEKGASLAPGRTECRWLHKAQTDYEKDGDLFLSLLRDNFLCTSSNFFFRRRLLVEIGHFRDLRYVNDLDFLLRALSRFKARYCESELLAYRQHAGNTLKEKELDKRVDFLLEVSLVLASALEGGKLVQRWDFSVLVKLLAQYYRLNLETVLFSILYFRYQDKGFKGIQEIAEQDLTVLFESGYRRLEEQEFVSSLQEAQLFHLEQSEAFQTLNKSLQQQMRLRDQEIARMEQLQHEVWQSREWYRQQYEMVINSRRFRLFSVLSELRHGRQIASRLRELLRILLPSAWRERLRRWRTQADFFRSDRNLWLFLQKKLVVYAGRLFDSHSYRQEIYGEAPLLTLLVSCDSGGDPLTRLHTCLKKQTWPHFEVIFLVCDGDREFKQKFSAVIAKEGRSGWSVLSADLSSYTGLCNRALGVAQGKYIVSLHSGDDLAPTFFEECLLLLEASPPHFFVQSANRLLASEEEDIGIVDPVTSLYENRFRAVVFPRLAGLALAGYDETMPTCFKEWEFYVKLIRQGYVGRSLPGRISRGLVCESVSAESHDSGFALGKKRIQALHLGYIVNHERWLRRRARQYWQVTEPLCNLLPSAGGVKKKALWLDLAARPAVPGSLFARLMARSEDLVPLIVTIDGRPQSFFRYNKKAGLQVYLAESYHLQGNRDYLYNYLQASYQLERVCPEDFLPLPYPASANPPKSSNRKRKLRILYVAPWLITGGADTMTVDWFCQLNSAWSDKYFVTTLFRDNNWLPKIADYAQGVYDLPALGCLDPAAMTDFLLEFIALQNIDILHIMNSEVAFHVLPQLKERFPDLKVVAQFHCFDYFADGRCTGYAFAMPPRYDHLIDRYNLEYPQLGEEIVQLYPYIERTKFKVIHGRVDSDFYNPGDRQPSAEIAAYQQKDVLNLLFIGRLDRQKQPLRLLKIAAALRSQGIPFVMHVIGDGNLESQKSEFLAELQGQGLADQVRFYGEQPLETLVDWYLIADVLLLTSDWEGVPMVLYQAMAMGVVPVVADVGGCAELVTPACGYLVAEKENAQAYVSAIKELLDDQRRHKMGSLARQRMLDHFSLAGLDREYKKFYGSLV